MKRFLLAVWLTSMAALASPIAVAFVEAPYVTPAHPTPDKPISVHVRMGGCHASFDDVDQAQLTMVSPGQLRLVTDGAALPPGHPFCIYDPPFTYRFDIGQLPAGSYTLRFFIYDDFSAPTPIEFGSVSFIVAAPARIPWASRVALTIIASLLLVAAYPRLSQISRD